MIAAIRRTAAGVSLPCEPWAAPYVAAPYVAPPTLEPAPVFRFKSHEIQSRVMALMADGIGRTVKQIAAQIGTESYYHTFNACMYLENKGHLSVQRFERKTIPSIYTRTDTVGRDA